MCAHHEPGVSVTTVHCNNIYDNHDKGKEIRINSKNYNEVFILKKVSIGAEEIAWR